VVAAVEYIIQETLQDLEVQVVEELVEVQVEEMVELEQPTLEVVEEEKVKFHILEVLEDQVLLQSKN
jgi:hypothetical protein